MPKEKEEKKEKITLKQQRDRINILIESLSENSSEVFGALVGTETIQALIWYLLSNTNTKTGQAMSQANNLILAGELIPTIDLPKGAVLGALLEKADDAVSKITDIVQRGEDITEVVSGKWWRTSFTRAQCRGYDSIVWESEGKPLTGDNPDTGSKGDPLYTSYVNEPYGYKGNDDPNKMGIPAVCVIRNNQTGNKDIVAKIEDTGNVGV